MSRFASIVSLIILLQVSNAASGDNSEESEDEETDSNIDGLLFSCRYNAYDLFTHAPAADLLYHLGLNALAGAPDRSTLKPFAAVRWGTLLKVKAKLATTTKSKTAKKGAATRPKPAGKGTAGPSKPAAGTGRASSSKGSGVGAAGASKGARGGVSRGKRS